MWFHLYCRTEVTGRANIHKPVRKEQTTGLQWAQKNAHAFAKLAILPMLRLSYCWSGVGKGHDLTLPYPENSGVHL